MKSLKTWLKEWNQTKIFLNLPLEERKIVFYSEGPGTTSHLRPIIECLTKTFNQNICFLTSDTNDILFEKPNPLVKSFFIGSGSARTFIFPRMKSKILITTTPNIQSKQLKKSDNTHYIYTNHSPVSTHMVYQENAFDDFDTFLCCGPHQYEEIKMRESIYKLKPKNLIKCGFPMLDHLLKIPIKKINKIDPIILIAPTWGSKNIIQDCAIELIETLIKSNYKILLRPHNMTWRHKSYQIKKIELYFSSFSNFSIDKDIDSINSVLKSDFLITDWSGIAMEYGFGLNKPVLFIDLPPKINNPNYKNIPITPLEESIRSELGEIIPLGQLNNINFLEKKFESSKKKTLTHKKLGNHWMYNLGVSSQVASEQIIKILQSL
tara:strand:- start:248 stop:1381 length:1134 start_codon:yes stop_codon:yes gene_type:complete